MVKRDQNGRVLGMNGCGWSNIGIDSWCSNKKLRSVKGLSYSIYNNRKVNEKYCSPRCLPSVSISSCRFSSWRPS